MVRIVGGGNIAVSAIVLVDLYFVLDHTGSYRALVSIRVSMRPMTVEIPAHFPSRVITIIIGSPLQRILRKKETFHGG
jgi:hypothetical protein